MKSKTTKIIITLVIVISLIILISIIGIYKLNENKKGDNIGNTEVTIEETEVEEMKRRLEEQEKEDEELRRKMEEQDKKEIEETNRIIEQMEKEQQELEEGESIEPMIED